MGCGAREAARHVVGAAQGFRYGLLSNVLNPKVAIFFLTLLPQFVDPSEPALAQTLLLGATHWVLSLVWLLALTAGLGLAETVLASRRVDGVTGGLLVGLGARLAMAAR